MAANYLHGIETLEKAHGARPVRVVKSAVIAVIGTAPAGPVNVLTQCLSERDGAQFGPDLPGFTLPSAFKAIYDQGVGTILAVNVLDPARHAVNVENALHAFGDNNLLQWENPPQVNPSGVFNAQTGAPYQPGQDYVVRAASGQIERLAGGAIAPRALVRVDYSWVDPSRVTPADIIGAIDMAGRRTGLQALEEAYNRFGYFAKILIAPGYCTTKAVSTALIAAAEKFRGQALIDAPIGATPAQVIEGRGPMGTINFDTSSNRAILCYPHLQVYDGATGGARLEPMSARLAGVMAAKDLEHGYWWSPSNTEFRGVIGVERALTARVDDPQSEVNALNEAGIVTVFNSFGTGLRSWGNRTAAWPSVTDLSNFINVRRTKDIIDESIRYSALQFVDRPITQALIDAITESVNQFLRKLTGDGALLGGQCWYDPHRNPGASLALGNVTFNYKLTIPPPFERGTFETEITGEYLVTLKGGN